MATQTGSGQPTQHRRGRAWPRRACHGLHAPGAARSGGSWRGRLTWRCADLLPVLRSFHRLCEELGGCQEQTRTDDDARPPRSRRRFRAPPPAPPPIRCSSPAGSRGRRPSRSRAILSFSAFSFPTVSRSSARRRPRSSTLSLSAIVSVLSAARDSSSASSLFFVDLGPRGVEVQLGRVALLRPSIGPSLRRRHGLGALHDAYRSDGSLSACPPRSCPMLRPISSRTNFSPLWSSPWLNLSAPSIWRRVALPSIALPGAWRIPPPIPRGRTTSVRTRSRREAVRSEISTQVWSVNLTSFAEVLFRSMRSAVVVSTLRCGSGREWRRRRYRRRQKIRKSEAGIFIISFVTDEVSRSTNPPRQ